MRGERLFRILGLTDHELVEEAAPLFDDAKPPKRLWWKPVLAAAACVAVICTVTPMLHSGNHTAGDAAPSAGGTGIGSVADNEPTGAEGTTFMSYAGPVFPLTLTEEVSGMTAERTTSWDFAPRNREDGTLWQWGAGVTDAYTLTNSTDAEMSVTLCYPYAGSLADLDTQLPTLTVNGVETEVSLSAGAYAGGFRDAGVADGSTWNLDSPNSWTDYRALLEDGGYLTNALGEYPVITNSVIVYSFTDFEAPAAYDAATQAIEFTIDPEKTTILTYGFNGYSLEPDSGWRQYDYFVPNGQRRDISPKMLIVLGQDIENYTLGGYENGACETPLDGVSCTVSRRETTLDAVLEELCAAYGAESNWQLGMDSDSVFRILSPELYRAKVTELLLSHGIFSGESMKDRYADGRLDEILHETLTQERVLYLTAMLTLPANSSTEVSFCFRKEPSFDYACSGSEHADLQGYDYAATLGSNITFTAEKAALLNTETIEIAGQNFGFDLTGGITTVTLDPAQEHYYLEIRPVFDR